MLAIRGESVRVYVIRVLENGDSSSIRQPPESGVAHATSVVPGNSAGRSTALPGVIDLLLR
jgi:hypothetical protein